MNPSSDLPNKNNSSFSTVLPFQPDPNLSNLNPIPYNDPSPYYSNSSVPNPLAPYPPPYIQSYPQVAYAPTGNIPQPAIYLPPSNPSQSSYIQPFSYPQIVVPSQNQNNYTNQNDLYSEENTLRYTQRAKCASIVNFIFDIMLVAINGGAMIIFLINIVGYLSTVKFISCLGTFYLVYLGSAIVVKVVLVAVFPMPIVIGLLSATAFVNAVTIVFFARFVKVLRGLSYNQIGSLRMKYQRQRCGGACCYW